MKTLRYISKPIEADLKRKMVFIGGPRQVGKTTLSLQFLNPSNETNSAYLNWDRLSDRKLILRDEIPLRESLLVFDEIHKFRQWRGLIKGIYDKNKSHLKVIVTGSA